MRASNRRIAINHKKAAEDHALEVWLSILAFIAGGLVSVIYNNWSISLYSTDRTGWGEWNSSVSPAINFLSYFIPSLDLVPRSLIAHGYGARAILVRHLYGVDWLICLVSSVLGIPTIVRATIRAKKNIARQRAPAIPVRAPNVQFSMDLLFCIFIGAAVVALHEAWLAPISYSGKAVVLNHVQWNNGDLYRVCIFCPLALIFSYICIAATYLKIVFRKK